MSNPVLRCKMVAESITNPFVQEDGSVTQEDVRLRAVYGLDGTANAQWSKWTPSGTLEMCITNPPAFGKLMVGREYYIDIIPVAE